MVETIRKHPFTSYLAVTFAISWGGLFAIAGPGGFPGTTAQTERLFPVALTLLLAGPCVAGLLLVGLADGSEGFRRFLSRLFNWRVAVRWYAVAVFAAPALVLVILLALSRFSDAFLPAIFTTDNTLSLLLSGIAVGLFGGVLEELGWTGYAVPNLRRQFGVLATGLIVGIVWGVWHFVVTYWASGDASGALVLDLLVPPLLFYGAVLPPFRVFMVWVYDTTDSLLLAILMHACLTASTVFILLPQEAALVPYYLVLAAVLWIMVAVWARLSPGRR